MARRRLIGPTAISVATAVALIVFGVAMAWWDQADRPADPTRPRHVRVVWTTDPAHRATILWTTGVPGEDVLYLDTRAHQGDPAAYPAPLSCGPGQAYAASDQWVHGCTLEGLQPSTKYAFIVSTARRIGRELSFVTAPADDRPFRVVFGGDSRTDRRMRQRVNRRIAALFRADPGIIAFAHGGDFIYDGRRWTEWSRWLTDYGLTTVDGRVLPIIPTRGNHEASGPLYGQVFGMPGGDGHYYTTRIGRFALITLNSEISQAGAQRDWLERTLEEASSSARWLVAQYHRPAFPAVKVPAGARRHWVPLFEAFDVDLVFESDGHVLKRTVPVRKERPAPDGVVYVGEGGLGVPQRRPFKRWYLEPPGMAASVHHVQVLSVTPQALEYRAVSVDGVIVDTYRRPVRPGR